MLQADPTFNSIHCDCDPSSIIVADGFLGDPMRVRRQALDSKFVDWDGPDGERYKRICIIEVPGLQDGIERVMGPVDVLGMGYRLNFGGELPNAAVHSDIGWGTHACVLYLSKGAGGTAFWQHKSTRAHRIDPGDTDLLEKVRGDWNDESKWDCHRLVRQRFNRAAIYDSTLFHSRYPFKAFGNDPQTGRLVAVAFFTPAGKS